MREIRLTARIVGNSTRFSLFKVRLSRSKPEIVFIDYSQTEVFHITVHGDYSFWFTREDKKQSDRLIKPYPFNFSVTGLSPLFMYSVSGLSTYPEYSDKKRGLHFCVDVEQEFLRKVVFEVGIIHSSLITDRRDDLREYFSRRRIKLDEPVYTALAKDDDGIEEGPLPYPFFNFGHHVLYLNAFSADGLADTIIPMLNRDRVVAVFQPSDQSVITDPTRYNYESTFTMTKEKADAISKSRFLLGGFSVPIGSFGYILS